MSEYLSPLPTEYCIPASLEQAAVEIEAWNRLTPDEVNRLYPNRQIIRLDNQISQRNVHQSHSALRTRMLSLFRVFALLVATVLAITVFLYRLVTDRDAILRELTFALRDESYLPLRYLKLRLQHYASQTNDN